MRVLNQRSTYCLRSYQAEQSLPRETQQEMVDIIGMIEQKNDGVLRRKVWNLLGDVKKDDHIQQCRILQE